jgi:ABC-type Na+ efflux pump permease subunit
VLGVVGIGLCAIAVSAASKLFGDTLDSEPWMIAALAVVYFVLGLMALWAGISGLRRAVGGRPAGSGVQASRRKTLCFGAFR